MSTGKSKKKAKNHDQTRNVKKCELIEELYKGMHYVLIYMYVQHRYGRKNIEAYCIHILQCKKKNRKTLISK